MEYKEYMDTLGEQIRDPRARRMVLQEIRAHIEEQCGAYEAGGMEHAEAMAESIRQMGDPAETGAELNRIHRPRISWGLIGVAVALTIVGILIQWNIFFMLADPPSWTNVWLYYGRNTIIYNLVGLAIMLGIMYLDYRFVGRRAYLWYGLYIGGLLVVHFWPLSYEQTQSVWYNMVSLYPLVLAGLIYRSRKQGLKGLVWCMALTLVVLAGSLIHISSASLEMLAVSGILLLLAVAKDIFGGKRLWQNLVLAGTALAGALLGLWNIVADGGWFNENIRRRFLYFLRSGEAASEAGYLALRQRKLMASCTLLVGQELSAFTAGDD
ncbi:MAG: permease prefix domain 1-containing protein [Acetatifactor sp.]|nr:permease prefix domain 1-containing protein [Acetatifactor sp.]